MSSALHANRHIGFGLSRADGFSLLESLFACTILTVGVLSLAHLFTLASSLNAASRQMSLAAILAGRKVEELRGGAASGPVEAAVDFVSLSGETLGGGDGPPPVGAAFVRRWSIEPLGIDPENTSVVQVHVQPAAGGAGAGAWDARIVTVFSRKEP